MEPLNHEPPKLTVDDHLEAILRLVTCPEQTQGYDCAQIASHFRAAIASEKAHAFRKGLFWGYWGVMTGALREWNYRRCLAALLALWDRRDDGQWTLEDAQVVAAARQLVQDSLADAPSPTVQTTP